MEVRKSKYIMQTVRAEMMHQITINYFNDWIIVSIIFQTKITNI